MRDRAEETGEASDWASFVEPHRREILVHCYRMTGSFADAEDLVQETFLRAWRTRESFRKEASFRTWLYRISTNVCLDALRKRRRRTLPEAAGKVWSADDPLPTEPAAGLWIEPCPDEVVEASGESPEARCLRLESVSLAFLEILQRLPARQRAVLLLADVLEWSAAEIADWLDSSVASVKSALHRARSTMTAARRAGTDLSRPAAVGPSSAAGSEQALLESFMKAWEANDPAALAALLRDDVILSMPPFPAWYRGKHDVMKVLALHPFGSGLRGGWTLRHARSNGLPAFLLFRADAPGGPPKAFGLMLLAIDALFVTRLTVYKGSELAERFGCESVLDPAS